MCGTSISSLSVCNVVCVHPHLFFIHPWFTSDICEHPWLLRCVCLCVVIVFPILCDCDCPPCPFSLPVFAELQQAGLITSKECKGLSKPEQVVRVQRGKSPETLNRTAGILRRHGFKNESNLLTGKQTQPLVHVPMVCFTVESSCKGHLKASIIVSFTHTMLGHSEWIPEPHCLPTWPPKALAYAH